MSIPGLPQGNRSRLYRRIVEQLKTDPTLSSVVKTWVTYEEDPIQAKSVSLSPALYLLPTLGGVGWFSPDSQIGPLIIRVEMEVQTTNSRDCLDLWEAIEAAIYPYNNRVKQQAFEQALRDLGSSHTGQITFSQPASIQSVGDGVYACAGMMQIDVIRPFSP